MNFAKQVSQVLRVNRQDVLNFPRSVLSISPPNTLPMRNAVSPAN